MCFGTRVADSSCWAVPTRRRQVHNDYTVTSAPRRIEMLSHPPGKPDIAFPPCFHCFHRLKDSVFHCGMSIYQARTTRSRRAWPVSLCFHRPSLPADCAAGTKLSFAFHCLVPPSTAFALPCP